MTRAPAAAFAAVLLAACIASCGEDDPAGTPDPGDGAPADTAPDFALLDVNPGSPSFGARVAPRDFLGRVSAWYFGHAT